MLFFREDFGHSENGILNFFEDYSRAIYKFRFYYSEPYALLKNDPEMLDLYRPRCEKLIGQLRIVFENWIETGIMPVFDVAVMTAFPGAIAATVPVSAETIATFSFELFQVTPTAELSFVATAAVSVDDFPGVSESVSGVTVTPVTFALSVTSTKYASLLTGVLPL